MPQNALLEALWNPSPPGYGIPPATTLLGGIAGLGTLSNDLVPSGAQFGWAYVERRFAGLLKNLEISDAQHASGTKKQLGCGPRSIGTIGWALPSQMRTAI